MSGLHASRLGYLTAGRDNTICWSLDPPLPLPVDWRDELLTQRPVAIDIPNCPLMVP